MKIIVESKIPFIKGVLEPFGDVEYLAPGDITAAAVADADALFVRTRTRCDASLLEHSSVKFIATATIGTDHIDLPWCESRGIMVANAPGCNAPAVAQYVISSILHTLSPGERPENLTVGIVGVGHVGRIVEQWARGIGMKVMLCDPPRAIAEGPEKFVSLDEIARHCDVITFHTPLTKSGEYPTFHLADRDFFEACRRFPLVINSARGPVTDTGALIDAVDRKFIKKPVIDCWENEPEISVELLDRAIIATPHIAGYSFQGKMRATAMVVKAFCDRFGFETPSIPELIPYPPEKLSAAEICYSYDPFVDTNSLKAGRRRFEALRNSYNYRNEPGFQACRGKFT